MLLLLINCFFILIINANSTDDLNLCKQTEYAYIIGDYQACLKTKELNEPKCDYIKTLCEIGNTEYEKARARLSKISSNVKDKKINFYNAMALNSLVEVAFLTGSFEKADKLAPDVNSLMSRDLPDSYPYIVSELLLVKSRYEKDLLSSFRRLEMLKTVNTDGRLFDSLNTEKW